MVREQRERIRTSGLLETMNITGTFVGNDPTEMPRFEDPRITMEYRGDTNAYEYPSLKKL